MTKKKIIWARLSLVVVFIAMVVLFFFMVGQVDYKTSESGSVPAADLKLWFGEYNQSYFLGALPDDTRVTYADLGSALMASTDHIEGVFHIRINPKLNPSATGVLMAILHEQCHVLLWYSDPMEQHGVEFQRCMHRLAAAGAFDDLW
jgi:hypothetical protein